MPSSQKFDEQHEPSLQLTNHDDRMHREDCILSAVSSTREANPIRYPTCQNGESRKVHIRLKRSRRTVRGHLERYFRQLAGNFFSGRIQVDPESLICLHRPGFPIGSVECGDLKNDFFSLRRIAGQLDHQKSFTCRTMRKHAWIKAIPVFL